MTTELVCSGFGGQGVLTTGQIVADIALACDMYPTWIPSYGAEMRGGRAFCTVKVDPVKVGTPALEEADILLAMNRPALSFTERMRSGGVLLINTDIVSDYSEDVTRSDITVHEIPFDSLAREIGNPKGANVLAAGVVCSLMGLDYAIGEAAMLDFFEQKGKGKFAEGNKKAFELGYHYLKQQGE